MSLIQRDDLIEQLAPAAADPALRDSILPRALDGGLHAAQLHGLNRSRDFQSILCVVIQNEELWRGLIGKCFAQLLDNPTAGRMPSDIEMQDASTVVADDEEAIKQVKCERRDREEIHGGDGFAVITQKRQPTVGRFWVPGRSSHPAGDGCLRYIESQHQQFAMDSRCTPGWILRHHLEDQRAGLLGDPPTTADRFSCFAEHRPIQFEPGSMPAHNRVR